MVYSSDTDKLVTGSRTGSMISDNISEQSERGEQYQQQIRRQRQITQRIRQLSKNTTKAEIRSPRNARFQNKEENVSKLSFIDIGLMSGIALIFDISDGLLSLIPAVGNVIVAVTITPVAALTLYLMYKRKGIEFKSTKTLIKFWGSLGISLIPIISILPNYVLNVVLVTLEKKVEEGLQK